ncbi:hypothetical protein HZ994_06190 [Akkermansiaceae bacterium]|nr:hypothetical protein HZ994_06190 [Akkermansiaceae bacterium]
MISQVGQFVSPVGQAVFPVEQAVFPGGQLISQIRKSRLHPYSQPSLTAPDWKP